MTDFNRLMNDLQAWKESFCADCSYQKYDSTTYPCRCIHMLIADLAKTDLKPARHGTWVWRSGIPYCSVCDEPANGDPYGNGDLFITKYCPHCGAELKGKKK